MLNIVPISSLSSITGVNPLGPVGGGSNMGSSPGGAVARTFSDYLNSAIGELDAADAQKTNDAYRLATGQIDDLSELSITSTKSELSLQMMVQIRNRLLDAYSEIMRISI
jgi:flagellar hook-basal body complex protein FliE